VHNFQLREMDDHVPSPVALRPADGGEGRAVPAP
jgi:hypothetical protein